MFINIIFCVVVKYIEFGNACKGIITTLLFIERYQVVKVDEALYDL